MNTVTYDTRSQAVQHFEGHTNLPHGKQRTALVKLIQESPRPMALAKQYLDRYGKRDDRISWRQLTKDLCQLYASFGPVDPVFSERIEEAKKLCREGSWHKKQHDALLKMLRESWCPWSKEDQEECREYWSDAV